MAEILVDFEPRDAILNLGNDIDFRNNLDDLGITYR